ncbi:TetR/AcrR family transcriptional regulator [Paenibacillus sp. 19GGS1-52]|uniref:TetR/AcrR family transcriptional regulator n=1 Tax=Paenibacillus sp. 19GGS1-52 TaxID=2758563 RepID=UPI001EFAA066|nr:TetR/AcrR family transcriptional regulator [Paenibacillus sp. 19GGS1-52]ULO09548.1 TetR/AcrR family transcriptional regulator [Paenibacillus sp. 19GGS1-52]
MGSDNDVKLRILLAAKKLFARQGFNATTVRQICDEADANISLVSYHFGGKDKVFEALFTEFFPHEILKVTDPQQLDPVSGLKLLIREITAYGLQEPDMVSLLQQEIVMQSPRMDKVREFTLPAWVLLRDWLKLGREQGVFHFRSLDQTFMSVLGCIVFHNKTFYFKPLFDNNEDDTESFLADLTLFILQSIGYVDAAASDS